MCIGSAVVVGRLGTAHQPLPVFEAVRMGGPFRALLGCRPDLTERTKHYEY
jgi:hypothetical protein